MEKKERGPTDSALRRNSSAWREQWCHLGEMALLKGTGGRRTGKGEKQKASMGGTNRQRGKEKSGGQLWRKITHFGEGADSVRWTGRVVP